MQNNITKCETLLQSSRQICVLENIFRYHKTKFQDAKHVYERCSRHSLAAIQILKRTEIFDAYFLNKIVFQVYLTRCLPLFCGGQTINETVFCSAIVVTYQPTYTPILILSLLSICCLSSNRKCTCEGFSIHHNSCNMLSAVLHSSH